MTNSRSYASRSVMSDVRDQREIPPIAVHKSETRHSALPSVTPLWNLTPQQWRVFLLVGKALSNKAIAHELKVAESTVKAHVSAIFKMAGCRNRTEAALLSQRVRFGMLDADESGPMGLGLAVPSIGGRASQK